MSTVMCGNVPFDYTATVGGVGGTPTTCILLTVVSITLAAFFRKMHKLLTVLRVFAIHNGNSSLGASRKPGFLR